MTEIIIPLDLWDEDIQGTLLGWLYADELTAPDSGKLRHVVAEDTLIDKGSVIGHIE